MSTIQPVNNHSAISHIDAQPTDIIGKILKFLPIVDVTSAGITSRKMALGADKFLSSKAIFRFFHSLMEGLDPSQSKLLSKFNAVLKKYEKPPFDKNDPAFTAKVATFNLQLRKEIFNILEGLESEDLNTLAHQADKIGIPTLLTHVFELARIHQIDNEDEMNEALSRISSDLIEKGDLDLIIEMSNDKITTRLFHNLKMNNRLHFAAKVATTLKNKFLGSRLLWQLSEPALETGNIKEAINKANSIPNETSRELAFEDIFKDLSIDEIKEYLHLVQSKEDQISILKQKIDFSDDMNEIIEAASLMGDEFKEGEALLEVSKKFVRKKEFEKAQTIAENISFFIFQEEALRTIEFANK